jgi:hypothetical protein
VYSSIPKYASIASILKPIAKKFLKKWFSPQISSKPPSPQETEHKKRGRKKKEKEKLQESIQIKGEVNILRGEKHFNFKILFDVIAFSSPPSYHFKNPFQNHWKSFLNSFWTIL